MYENKEYFEQKMKYEGNECKENVQACDMMAPVMECPKEVCCHRYIYHDVPHIMPMNTRIINHHVYRHSYIPEYTCCEENEYCNVYGPRC